MFLRLLALKGGAVLLVFLAQSLISLLKREMQSNAIVKFPSERGVGLKKQTDLFQYNTPRLIS